ncbi:hypothetical protein [Neptuniibacter sp. CAU 1671]|uniref:hypothetical protein n=1 Tax=Neptuniibacter sp. CAU 1671 TaxID=3032593 RepID=UPI0023DC6A1B|nr:hypothetical protein [Neptuniibacter sp. CAU 1671]MDF2183161.1 hypothetical protein [Neptuniibacter sp. CAU 1671]
MNDTEKSAHILVRRLNYLLERLEAEFFHIHPNLEENGKTTSLALTSILNEALNLHEAAFHSGEFWPEITEWGNGQDWKWEKIKVRFTYWPVLVVINPFSVDLKGKINISGRAENNSTKHQGELASLESALFACAAAWFIVLEKAREAEVFLGTSEADDLMKLFDCYDLINISQSAYGLKISRPLANRVEYPAVRGSSEIPLAKDAFEKRIDFWKFIR